MKAKVDDGKHTESIRFSFCSDSRKTRPNAVSVCKKSVVREQVFCLQTKLFYEWFYE